jgi:hypothetical protein
VGSPVSTTASSPQTTPPSSFADSAGTTVNIVGTWCFRAVYTPGGVNGVNYTGSSDATSGECFTVPAIATTTKTTPSVGSGGTTPFGSSVSDHAVVAAVASGDDYPSGTVTFYICDPTQTTGGACPTGGTQVGSPVSTTASSPQTTPPSAFADSAGTTVNMTGTWCFRAVYTPGGVNGANYIGSSDATSGECFTVTDTTSGSSNQIWYPNDSATVTSAHGAPLNGTLTLQLYDGSNDCTTGAVTNSAVDITQSVSGGSSATISTNGQTSYGISGNDTISWLVSFNSSDPNVASSKHCETSSISSLTN